MTRCTALIAGVLTALVAVPRAQAVTHGFRDPRAPQEAARVLNTLPDVDRMKCHWKKRGHTIGCVGLVNATIAQMFLWSNGKRIRYHVCASGVCSKDYTAKHVFGRPY